MSKDYSNWKTRYNGIKGLVDNILAQYPETRTSYERLVLKVWEHYGIKVEGDVSKLPSIETINRSRRDLDLSYPLPPALKEVRNKQQEFFRKKFSE